MVQLLYSPLSQRGLVAASQTTLLFLHGQFSGALFSHRFNGPAIFYFTAGVWGENWLGYHCADGDGNFPGTYVK